MAEFEQILRQTIQNEGGYVNDPADAGGETKFGISKRQYPNLDIKSITVEQAQSIYYKDYWQPLMGYALREQTAAILFDSAVNMGVVRSIRMAQKIAHVPADGIMGPQSLKALNALSETCFLNQFAVARIKRYTTICRKKPTQKKYLYGWIKRTVSRL